MIPSTFKIAAAALLACGLAACGGSDDDEAPAGGAPSPAAGVTIGISGVAATGAAIAGGTIDVKCKAGTGTATSAANGTYAVTVANGELPCVIRLTTDGTTLHSLVESGAALPTVANVTPLTELLVAQIAIGAASNVFDNFDATAQARLTPAAVTTATNELVASLLPIIDFTGDNLLRGTVVPAIDGEGGNLLDQKLDALALALAQTNTSLGALSSALVANPGQPPAALQDAPATATLCPALRSGTYWGLEGEDPGFSADPFEIDARALTATYTEGETTTTVTYVPVAGQPCRFTVTDAEGVEDVVVSQAGILVSHFTDNGVRKPAIAFPKQPLPLSTVAGTWNYAGYVGPMANFEPVHGNFTIDAQGAFSDVADYVGTVGGPASGEVLSLEASQTIPGAFALRSNGVLVAGVWLAYRAPDGNVFLFSNPQGGQAGLVLAAKRAPLAIPTVGTVNQYWEYQVLGTLNQMGLWGTLSNTTLAVDGKIVSRRREATQDFPVRIDRVQLDQPRVGMRARATNDCTTAEGAPLACGGAIGLPLPGTGIVASVDFFANSAFSISVARP